MQQRLREITVKQLLRLLHTPVQKTATEGAGELSELEKFFAKLEAKGKKTIKIGKEGDEIDVILYRGKHNDYIKSDGKIFRVRYSN